MLFPLVSAYDLTVGQGSVETGSFIDISIDISEVPNLFGIQFDATFDENVVEFVSAEGGAFFSDAGAMIDTNTLSGKSDLDGNVLNNFVVLRSFTESEGLTGTGTVATLKFKGKTVGTSSITLSQVLLSDPSANPLVAPDAITVGSVTVTEATSTPDNGGSSSGGGGGGGGGGDGTRTNTGVPLPPVIVPIPIGNPGADAAQFFINEPIKYFGVQDGSSAKLIVDGLVANVEFSIVDDKVSAIIDGSNVEFSSSRVDSIFIGGQELFVGLSEVDPVSGFATIAVGFEEQSVRNELGISGGSAGFAIVGTILVVAALAVGGGIVFLKNREKNLIISHKKVNESSIKSFKN